MRAIGNAMNDYLDGSDGAQDERDRRQDRKIRKLVLRQVQQEEAQGGLLQKGGAILSSVAALQALTSTSNKAISDLAATATGNEKILADAIAKLQTGAKLNAVGDLGKVAVWFKNGYTQASALGLLEDDDDMGPDAAWEYFQSGAGNDNTMLIVLVAIGFLVLYRRADGTSFLDGILG